MDGMVEVQTGTAGGYTWRLCARREADGQITSQVEFERGPYAGFSGQTGPGPDAYHLVQWAVGKATGQPAFVVVRAAPKIRSARVLFADREPFGLEFNPVIPEFGIRLVGAPLPNSARVIDIAVDLEEDL
jgi:hypothetical protein